MTNAATEPRQSALDASRRTAKAIHDVGAMFMLDLDMYAEVAALGYEGTAFYFAGRGGVLGDVGHTEVFEALCFFPDESVRTGWESSVDIESRSEAAGRFASYAARWAAANVPDSTVDLARLADLCGTVVSVADASHAPVFAGWRDLPEPEGERELAVHRMNALRELRAARHIAAVREVGMEPVDAFMVRTPYMAAIFGWPVPDTPPSDDDRATWERAEELTDRSFAADLSVLGDEELLELCELCEQLLAAVS